MKTMLLNGVLLAVTTFGGPAPANKPAAGASCCNGSECCDNCPTCCVECCGGDCCGAECCGNCPACCK
jgi:hypothetical protein